MDVLDDLYAEAIEVAKFNRWLTYCEPIHRIREFGVRIKELDLIDEASLTSEQMLNILAIILGGRKSDYPYPEDDFGQLWRVVQSRLSTEGKVWSVSLQSVRPWIEKRYLSSAYQRGFCTGCVVM